MIGEDKMKKLCSLLLILCLLLSLSACGNDKSIQDTNSGGFCVECGGEISSTDKFCGSCGVSVNKTNSTDSTDSTTTESETSKPSSITHTHSYSGATCTAPAKCSCGATNGSVLGHNYSEATCTEAKKCSRCGVVEGNALGHKWQDATCKTPKICSVCKASEGNIGNHKYTSGKCVCCGDKQIIDPKTGLKQRTNYFHERIDEQGIYFLYVYQFNDSFLDIRDEPWGVYTTNEEWKESDNTISYKGKTYYPIGYGGPLPRYYIKENEIVLDYKYDKEVSDYYGNAEYRLIVNYEYDLEVIYSSNSTMFKKGDILELVE